MIGSEPGRDCQRAGARLRSVVYTCTSCAPTLERRAVASIDATAARISAAPRLPKKGLTAMQLPRDGQPTAANGHEPNGTGLNVGGTTIVMGAGPGGLCSAYVLSKAGVP